MFIERVKFTEPYSLQLVGGDDQRLETFLAQKGILSEDDIPNLPFHPIDQPIVTPYPPIVEPYPPGVVPPPGGGYPPGTPPTPIPPGGGVLYPCGQIPLGGIIMWSGAIADIDTVCWALCDGTPPTPDLRNRFIVGAGVDDPTLNFYQVGDTGGLDEVDISHLHAAGTLAADNESAHTHGIGTYAAANESSHTHGDGTYAAANDTHDHNDTFTIDNDAHTHDVTGTSGSEATHYHVAGNLSTATPTNTPSGHAITDGASTEVLSLASHMTHVHEVTGNTQSGVAHSHGDGTYAAASDTHNHGISGSVSNDTHGHDVTGTSGAGSAHTHSLSGTSGAGSAHGHTISGNTATGGDTTHDNRPQYYALAFIMRIA